MKIRSKIMAGGIFILFLGLIGILLLGNINGNPLFRKRPNIVIVLLDDGDRTLMPYLTQTNTLLIKKGASFTNYFVTAPLCCPSRASMLTGQYPHNTGILQNTPGFYSFHRRGKEMETLAVWLSQSGYRTSLIGKYLNGYPINAGREYVPPGWTDWHAFLYQRGNSDFYYDYSMNENGEIVKYDSSPEDYSTDVIREKAIHFINESISADDPFFLLISVYAPHGPSIPASRHAGLFSDAEYPQNASFNEADISDKPVIFQELASSTGNFDAGDANALYVQRVQSVQAVDELVEEVVHLLEQQEQIDNTYILFTSDNGFHMGEHRLPSGKGMLYEEDIHVPFIVYGPGIPPGMIVSQLVANTDLAPTIAEIAGLDMPASVDGRSILPLLHPDTASVEWRKAILLEMGYMESTSSTQSISFSLAAPGFELLESPDSIYDQVLLQESRDDFRALRMENFVYAEYSNAEIEFYDLATDPYQLTNTAANLSPKVRAALHSWLEELTTCSGVVCRETELILPVDLQGLSGK
ncbi:MAG: sulfatase [Chloroflexota bacterium]